MAPNIVVFTIGCFVAAMIVWMIYRVMVHIALWALSSEEKKKPSGIVSGTEGFYTGTVQQDTAAREVKKRMNSLFEAQKEEMTMRVMKSHSCDDPLLCRKESCFVVTPDKIVKQTVDKKKSVEQRTQELVESDKRNKSNLKKLKYGMEKKQ